MTGRNSSICINWHASVTPMNNSRTFQILSFSAIEPPWIISATPTGLNPLHTNCLAAFEIALRLPVLMSFLIKCILSGKLTAKSLFLGMSENVFTESLFGLKLFHFCLFTILHVSKTCFE